MLYPFSSLNATKLCIKSTPATLSGNGFFRYLLARITDAPSAFITPQLLTISRIFAFWFTSLILSALTPIRCNGVFVCTYFSTKAIVSLTFNTSISVFKIVIRGLSPSLFSWHIVVCIYRFSDLIF